MIKLIFEVKPLNQIIMSYFYYLFALIPFLGYILSKLNGRVPKGLIDRSQLSKKISETANWQLPITVFGILFYLLGEAVEMVWALELKSWLVGCLLLKQTQDSRRRLM